MRAFLAGATGAIGRPLVARLLAAGHEVVGTTRREERAASLRAAGVEAVVLDVRDADALRAAVVAARPEVVVQQLTDLPADLNTKGMRRGGASTSALRVAATRALAEAARAAGARRLVAQSIAFATAPVDGPVLDEDAPLYGDGPPALASSAAAIGEMERLSTQTPDVEGVVLRYGFFYGPGTWYHRDGSVGRQIAARRFPLIGAGTGVWSWVHVDDCVEATALALDRGRGVLNVADDEPARMADWLPATAAAIGAGRPLRVPALVARLAAGPEAVHYGLHLRGASNARAREQLGWAPAHPSWREGLARELG